MAEATFTIRAVDATRAAFISVQDSLKKIQTSTKAVATSIKGAFGFGALIMLGSKLNRTLEDAEKNAQMLGLSSEELDKLTVATDFADQAAFKLQKTAALAAATLAGAFTGADVAAKAADIRFRRVGDTIEELKRKAQETFESIAGIDDTDSVRFARLGDAIAKLNREIAASNKSVDAVKNAERQVKIAELQFERATMAASAYREMDDALGASAAAEEEYNMSLLTEAEQQAIITRQLDERKRSMIEIKRLLGDKMEGIDILNATPRDIALMNQMKQDAEEYNKLLGKRKVLESDLARLARDAGDMMASGFEDAIFAGEKLSNTLRNLAVDLMRLVFRQMITEPMAAGVSGAIKSIFGFRAEGGPVTGRSPYVVGERGPEVFVPGTSGAIIPNDKLGAAGGGGGGSVNITYNIQSGVSRAELAPILENERKRLRNEIPDMVRRGGSYRAAFA